MSVTMIDAGRSIATPEAPTVAFDRLTHALPDAPAFWLGPDLDGALLPGRTREYYGFPPHREAYFRGESRAPMDPIGFEPLTSTVRGGLAEAWTAGAFPFDAEDLRAFPFSLDTLLPYYGLVAKRIGITGAIDDLAHDVPVHAHLDAPLPLDAHSAALLAAYTRRRGELTALGVRLGRSRTAVLREGRDGRQGCDSLGRCLWGCPREAIWTPSLSLRQLEREPRFDYRPGWLVTRVALDASRRAVGVVAESLEDGAVRTWEARRVVLAAGTLGTSRIVLSTLRHHGGDASPLEGLMDNRQVLVPFITPSRLGAGPELNAYQYHQLAMGLSPLGDRPHPPLEKHYVHCLITILKGVMIHPIVQTLPVDLRTALALFRLTHGALGIANVNLADTRRPGNRISLDLPTHAGEPERLRIEYRPTDDEPQRLRHTLARVRRALRTLGSHALPGMAHVRPMGAGVHYAGTLPMSHEARPRSTDPDGRLRDVHGVWVIDGSTLPFLPSKNLTFTLMANAARIAERLCAAIGPESAA